MHAVNPAITKLPPASTTRDELHLPHETRPPDLSRKASIPEITPQDSLTAFLAPHPGFFIGREHHLKNLQQLLLTQGIVVVIPEEDIFCQIGKSMLSSQCSKAHSSVLWILARNKKALDASFTKLASLFNIEESSKVREYLSQQNRLVVFDGAQDPELLKDYIPQGKCQVVITSRRREWPFPKIEIGPFSLQEAVDFLCQSTQKNDQVAAKRIAEEMDCLPTSLEKAAKAVVEHQAELAGYSGIKEGILDKNSQLLKERSNLGNRNRNFTGREMALVALEEALKTTSRAVITAKRRVAAEVGLGGVGKTQIALQYAVRNAGKYPFLVWRVNCESSVTLQESYRLLAEKMGVYLAEEEKKQENALIKKVNRRLEKETGWLLIYDNAESQKDLEGLTPNQGGHVLITSRSPDWDIGFAHVFKIGVFKRKESISLIQKITPLNIQDANQLAELVKDLPIAVVQAAAYIRQTHISYTEYEKLFKEKSGRLLPAQEPTDEYSRTVNVTWQISMEKISEQEKTQAEAFSTPYPIAIPLMNFCAFLGSSDIPKEHLLLPWVKTSYKREATALEDLNRTLAYLRAFFMIDIDDESISIHKLVQLVTRNKQDNKTQKEGCSKAIAFFRKIFIFDLKEVQRINNNKRLILHAKKLVKHAWNLQTELWDALMLKNYVGGHLAHQGIYSKALDIFHDCLNKSIDLELDNLTSAALCGIGDIYINLGFYNYAKEVFDLVLKDEANNSTIRRGALHGRGQALQNIGKYKEAQKDLEECLKLIPSENILDIARLKSSLGNVFCELGNYVAAEHCFKQVLDIYIGIYSENYYVIGDIKNDLGIVLNKIGKCEEAKNLFKEVLNIYKEAYAEDHPIMARPLVNLGDAFLLLRQVNQAIISYEIALLILYKNFLSDHPRIAIVRNSLGCAYLQLENYLKAREQFEEALKTNLPEEHSLLGEIACNLGALCQVTGEYAEAEMHLNKALSIFGKALPSDHPNIAGIYYNLGTVLNKLTRHIEAKECYMKSLHIYKKIYPSEHPLITQVNQNLEALDTGCILV